MDFQENQNNSTIDEPKDPAMKYPKVLLYVKTVKTPIVIVEKKTCNQSFL